jgi:hypothetical protein
MSARCASDDVGPTGAVTLGVAMTPSPAYLSAELLLDRVWGEDVGPFTRAAPVTVGRLRRRLGQPQVIENGRWGGQPDSGLALGAEFVTRLARKEGETASCAECSVWRQLEEPAGDRSTRLNDGYLQRA